MELTSREEKSLLLYFEAQAVDCGGAIESARLNANDFAIVKRWNEAGFVQYGRIALRDITKLDGVTRDHWCVLSEEAWTAAHTERRARCQRLMEGTAMQRIGLAPNAEGLCASARKDKR